ncbi:MAG: Lrp/AsnC family transcriptional regulator [Verrucomicrobiales bacterium]|jgi:DNA-binding Lrp family transcriptional regulator|nr:AsnC family transcriptional regulator [Pedosphaera sp.]MEC7199731.1 Lrp/AsnC family transcriptional regulator [Verrucomicrobiota bacterium]HBF03524.1 AsnC family transcriptional regulator [Verrucomicrobiales bacterium]MAN32126.1 AsnC family transcriptional regulator [Pedosphaera sp.]MEC8720103.1 Lrp/AsnC family transcriptional regulator [Verrucomicrobiota bacterium]|tara:strand:- start:305 stop:784 length:480 start_codon:yes stop_codon:yes gene_type:complete
MEPLLKLLRENASYSSAQLAQLLDMEESEVKTRIQALEDDRTILGYMALINDEKIPVDRVRAVIEVKLTPEREGGFNHLASRIARHREVTACYLMSGSYDLLAFVEGESLKDVASFVSEKLSTLQGVVSTSTHFMLKPYKEHGMLLASDESNQRLHVAP